MFAYACDQLKMDLSTNNLKVMSKMYQKRYQSNQDVLFFQNTLKKALNKTTSIFYPSKLSWWEHIETAMIFGPIDISTFQQIKSTSNRRLQNLNKRKRAPPEQDFLAFTKFWITETFQLI